jgi:adenylate cyclase
VWQPWHSPQPVPSRSHCSAAANARAATDRPDPGGPVKIHACVMAPFPVALPVAIRAADAAACRSVSTASS